MTDGQFRDGSESNKADPEDRGSSTHPGGGVMGAPGVNAAREMLRDMGLRMTGWDPA